MANFVQIPNLPAATALNGTEQLEAVQAGVSVRATVAQIGNYLNLPPSLALVVNMAELAVVTPIWGVVLVQGFYAAYDNGGGVFAWIADSLDTPIPGMIVQVTGVAVGRYKRQVDGPLYATWFGAWGGDDSTVDNAVPVNRALAYADDMWGGGTVILPPGIYQEQTEIVLGTENLKLILEDGVVLKQMHYGFSFVQIRADYCEVSGGATFINPVTKTEITGSYENNPARVRAAGVYILGANYSIVDHLTIQNSVCGVVFLQADALRLTERCFGNRLSRLNIQHYDFGMLGSNQQNMVISDIAGYWADRSQGNVADDDNGPAPHLMYLSGRRGQNLKNQNITVADCVDFFNLYASSYKAKFTDGLTLDSVQSQLCVRGFEFDAQNVTVVSPQVRDIIGQIAMNFNATCSDVEVIDPLVYIETDLSAYSEWLGNLVIDFNLIETFVSEDTCSNITVRGGKLSHSHSTNESQIKVAGRNIRFIDVQIEERGSSDAFPFTVKASSIGAQIIRPAVSHGAQWTITSGSYNSTTGVATLNVASQLTFGAGVSITVSGATGTGSFAAINGVQTTIATTAGTTIHIQLATGLTMTITGGAIQVGIAGTRIASVASGATGTIIEIDPLVLNFTYGSSSISDGATAGQTTVRRLDGTVDNVWVPVPTFVTPNNFAPTITTADAWYHQWGEWVFAGCTLIIGNTNPYTGVSGDFRLTGIPFTCVSPVSGGYTFSAPLAVFRNITGTYNALGVQIGSGDNFFTLRASLTGASGAGATLDKTYFPPSTADIRFQFQIMFKGNKT